MEDKEVKELINKAITKSSYRWRTPEGIAKDSGISVPQVLETLEKTEGFIRSRKANAQGATLYTTREKYKKTSSIGQRLLSAITNKITD
jgi:hypothetical protein